MILSQLFSSLVGQEFQRLWRQGKAISGCIPMYWDRYPIRAPPTKAPRAPITLFMLAFAGEYPNCAFKYVGYYVIVHRLWYWFQMWHRSDSYQILRRMTQIVEKRHQNNTIAKHELFWLIERLTATHQRQCSTRLETYPVYPQNLPYVIQHSSNRTSSLCSSSGLQKPVPRRLTNRIPNVEGTDSQIWSYKKEHPPSIRWHNSVVKGCSN